MVVILTPIVLMVVGIPGIFFLTILFLGAEFYSINDAPKKHFNRQQNPPVNHLSLSFGRENHSRFAFVY